MQILLKIYNVVGLCLFMIILRICGAGMEKKWMKMMHNGHETHHNNKGVTVKAFPLPIPILVKEKGDTQPEKSWKDETKDMFWKMMMVKMIKGDKGKGCDKGCPTVCCPQKKSDGWHGVMKGIKAIKAMKGIHGKKPCCPFMIKGCNKGWNAPPCCKGGWNKHPPPEEPDYYDYDYY